MKRMEEIFDKIENDCQTLHEHIVNNTDYVAFKTDVGLKKIHSTIANLKYYPITLGIQYAMFRISQSPTDNKKNISHYLSFPDPHSVPAFHKALLEISDLNGTFCQKEKDHAFYYGKDRIKYIPPSNQLYFKYWEETLNDYIYVVMELSDSFLKVSVSSEEHDKKAYIQLHQLIQKNLDLISSLKYFCTNARIVQDYFLKRKNIMQNHDPVIRNLEFYENLIKSLIMLKTSSGKITGLGISLNSSFFTINKDDQNTYISKKGSKLKNLLEYSFITSKYIGNLKNREGIPKNLTVISNGYGVAILPLNNNSKRLSNGIVNLLVSTVMEKIDNEMKNILEKFLWDLTKFIRSVNNV
ncbi:MAG: hypothetical protein MJB14_13640 [Spirochaetes bacterium]|nr:hypothetical protein [Spirochaetota bacterium]